MAQVTDQENPSQGHLSNNGLQRQIFINYLTQEIDEFRNERRRPGWTTWAICVSFATTAWFFLHELDIESFPLLNIARLILIVSFFVDLFRTITSINISSSPQYPNRFNLAKQLLGSTRFLMLVFLLYRMVLLYFIWLLLPSVEFSVSVTAYLINAFFSVFTFIALLFSYFPIPFPKKPQAKITPFLDIGISIGSIYCIIYYLNPSFYSSIMPSEIRLAGLLVVMGYLIFLYIGSSSEIPLLSSLVNIRREVALNRMDLNEAIKQTDLVLSGLQVSDLFEEEIQQILQLNEGANTEINKLVHNLEILEKKGKQENISFEDKAIIDSLLLSSIHYLEKIIKFQEQNKKKVGSFTRKAIFIIGISKETKPAIAELIEKIESSILDTDKKLRTLQERTGNLRSQYKEQHKIPILLHPAKTEKPG